MSETNQNNKKKISITTVLIIVFAIIFVFSAFKLIKIKLDYKKAKDTFDDLSNSFHAVEQKKEPDGENEEPVQLTNAERFAMLREQNSDLAAWISIEGTNIDYPVMLTPGNPEYYLYLDFYENYSINGTPFIGAGCDLDSDNMIIHGHCMKDGSMFNNLLLYEGWDFFNSHRSFRLETPDASVDCVIVAAFREKIHYQDEKDAFRYYNYTGMLTEDEYYAYVNSIKAISFYDTGVWPAYGEQLVTLSTCHYAGDEYRMVVVGVRR